MVCIMTDRGIEESGEIIKVPRGSSRSVRETINFVFCSVGVAVVGVLLLLVISYGYYGDVFSMTERLRGYTVLIEHPRVGIDSVDHDSGLACFSVNIKNLTSKPVKIIGYEAGCSCVHFENMPVTLGAHEVIGLKGNIHWKGEFQNSFEYVVRLFLDSDNSPVSFVIESR